MSDNNIVLFNRSNELLGRLIEKTFEGNVIRVFRFNNEAYFFGKDVASALEYSNTRQAIITNCKRAISVSDLICGYDEYYYHNYKICKLPQPQTKVIKQDEVLNLIYKSNSSSDEYRLTFVNWLKHNKLINKNFNFILSSFREEIRFFDKLQIYLNNIFKLKAQTQFSIGPYFIDGYIIELKLAIEFDENGHKHYNQDKEKIRQQFIEKVLKCEFIRLTNKNSIDHNISQVILKINNMVYNKNEI